MVYGVAVSNCVGDSAYIPVVAVCVPEGRFTTSPAGGALYVPGVRSSGRWVGEVKARTIYDRVLRLRLIPREGGGGGGGGGGRVAAKVQGRPAVDTTQRRRRRRLC